MTGDQLEGGGAGAQQERLQLGHGCGVGLWGMEVREPSSGVSLLGREAAQWQRCVECPRCRHAGQTILLLRLETKRAAVKPAKPQASWLPPCQQTALAGSHAAVCPLTPPPRPLLPSPPALPPACTHLRLYPPHLGGTVPAGRRAQRPQQPAVPAAGYQRPQPAEGARHQPRLRLALQALPQLVH